MEGHEGGAGADGRSRGRVGGAPARTEVRVPRLPDDVPHPRPHAGANVAPSGHVPVPDAAARGAATLCSGGLSDAIRLVPGHARRGDIKTPPPQS